MNRRVRLALWIVTAVGALAWPVFLPKLMWGQSPFIAALFCLVCLAPSDAIRLPRQLSNGLVITGVLLMQAVGLKHETTSPLIFGAIIAITSIQLLACSFRRVSPWWIVPAMWGWWTMRGWTGVLIGSALGMTSLFIGARCTRVGNGVAEATKPRIRSD